MKKILLLITLINFSIINAQIVNIPDANFKAYLVGNTTINNNGDGEIQIIEAQNCTGLIINDLNIIDLTGIEAFTNLTSLDCRNNQLNSLDISNNVFLTYLKCEFNQIGALDFSNNTNLEKIFCANNQLIHLNVSNNENLDELFCENNQLTNLDIENNIDLQNLSCGNNQLTTLNITNNNSLYRLYCGNNLLSTINVNANENLIAIIFSNNLFSTIDLSNNTNLVWLWCNDNPNLEYLNLKNGHNNSFLTDYWSNFKNNLNLQCVCVDELNSNLTDFIFTEIEHSTTFYIDCTTSCSSLTVNEKETISFITFPTPTENILNIKSKIEINNIEIYNKLGQLILKNTTGNKIDISSLVQGLYFVKVEDIKGNFGVKKIMKK